VRWRIALLKDAYPGPGVAISHGQAHGHWRVVNPGGLFINLESMWDDYEQSIDSMIKTLAADDARRENSLEWIGAASAASVSFSETAVKPEVRAHVWACATGDHRVSLHTRTERNSDIGCPKACSTPVFRLSDPSLCAPRGSE